MFIVLIIEDGQILPLLDYSASLPYPMLQFDTNEAAENFMIAERHDKYIITGVGKFEQYIIGSKIIHPVYKEESKPIE